MSSAPTIALAWLHDLSPFVVRISGDFGVRWYGVAYVAGFVIGYLILRWLGGRGAALIPPQRAADAIIVLVMGVMIGGRLGYVVFYEPSLFVRFTPGLPWWGVLQINKGGMASHGGMLGVLAAAWWLSRGMKGPDGQRSAPMPWMHVMDLTAVLAPAGLFLGRVANFINGELLGKIAAMPGTPAPWWSVKFPQEYIDGHDCGRLLAPEAAAARRAAIDGIITKVSLPSDTEESGYNRLLEKIQGGSRELARELEPWISARHPSQIYQAVAEGLVLGVALWMVWRAPRKPGVISGLFLVLYGILRVLTELYRLPDAQFAEPRPTLLGIALSRGQWLSVGMVVAGLVVLVIAAVRPGPKLGGWGAARTVA